MKDWFHDLLRPVVGRKLDGDDFVGILANLAGVMSFLIALVTVAALVAVVLVWIGT